MNSKLVIAASMVAFSAAFALPAAAADGHRLRHRHHHHDAGRELVITRHYQPQPVIAAPDPYHGPAAVITGPVAFGSTVVSLPFRAANSVFPPYGDPSANPLVIVGAPVHVLGQAAQFPFYAVGSAFGAPPIIY